MRNGYECSGRIRTTSLRAPNWKQSVKTTRRSEDMTTVRQHMKVFHDGAAAHWQSTAAHHEKEAARNAGFAKCYASMAKTADSEAWNEFADEHGQAAKDHEQYAKLCADYSAFHETCASDCEKSEQDQLGKTLRPDPYTSITPRD